MEYDKIVNWLYSKLPIYQRSGEAAYKKDIGNIKLVTSKLGDPHLKFKNIHIAGTNGKGSTANMLASILQESGYKTGLYTSPHLKDFRERIRINGEKIRKNTVINFISKNKIWFEKIEMSFFEMTVAMAFDHFRNEKVDIAIIETGLGGRLDSTNIINPELSVITNISLDHTKLLGNDLQSITKEKAGIIKENTPVIIGRRQKETDDIFKQVSKNKKSELIYSKPSSLQTDLKGKYQKENVGTVVTIIKQMNLLGWEISNKSVQNGLLKIKENLDFKGRWEILNTNPLTITDTAHNSEGIQIILDELNRISYTRLHFVLGFVQDKNVKEILNLLPKNAIYYFSEPDIPRALDKEELYQLSIKYNLKGNVFQSVQDAFNTAKKRAEEKDLIFITGSTFVVAEIL